MRGGVLARALAQFLARLGDIENVVDHLESEAEREPEITQRAKLCRGRVCAHRPESNRSSKERGRFVLVDVTQLRAVDFLPLAFEVRDLAGDQFLTSGRNRDLADNGANIITRPPLRLGGNLKRDREKRVTGKDRNPVTENLVTSWATAAEIVVIHAWEVIVDQ
jgi:hypothetical protein